MTPSRRIPFLLLLFAAAPVLEASRLPSLSALTNGDIWWHLRTGLWILQNHALPHSGLFSQSTGAPWIASNWGFDVLLASAYRLFGLRSIPILAICFKAALALLTFLLAGGTRGRFWPAIALSALVQYVLAGFQPGPAYCSLLLFSLELLLLIESRNAANARLLFWLPPLFLVWANLDSQFVYGIILLLLSLPALVGNAIGETGAKQNQPSTRSLAIVIAASFLATLITPYFYRPYEVFFATVTSAAASKYLPDFHAMSFHQPQDYLLMLLTMAAFLALGIRRSRDWFSISVLVACAIAAFHSQRDIWLVAIAAVAVIGSDYTTPTREIKSGYWVPGTGYWLLSTGYWVLTAGLAIVLGLSTVLLIPRDRMLAKIAETYPVAAANYIRDHQLPQPLFNAYEWGGFLTWYLPEYPVAIDNRTDLYGDNFITQYSKMMNADIRYTDWPPINDARTILLPKSSNMGQAFANVPAFKLLYSDDLALVLERQDSSQSPVLSSESNPKTQKSWKEKAEP